MYLKYAPNPREYILSRQWDNAQLQYSRKPNDLERAIIYYTVLSHVKKGETIINQTTSYSKLQELVFEYYRVYKPSELRAGIERNIQALERVDLSSTIDEYRNRVQVAKAKFMRLRNKPIPWLTYAEFEPRGFGSLIDAPSGTLFKRHCDEIIHDLIRRGLMVKSELLGKRYVGVNFLVPRAGS